jgi:acetoin utilization deacetylase AcuC-like enzyme
MKAFDNAISKAMIRDFEHIAVSAGFDAFGGDLASLGLTERTYSEIGKKIRSLEKRTFFVLEGGYSGRNIGKSVTSLLSQFQN